MKKKPQFKLVYEGIEYKQALGRVVNLKNPPKKPVTIIYSKPVFENRDEIRIYKDKAGNLVRETFWPNGKIRSQVVFFKYYGESIGKDLSK